MLSSKRYGNPKVVGLGHLLIQQHVHRKNTFENYLWTWHNKRICLAASPQLSRICDHQLAKEQRNLNLIKSFVIQINFAASDYLHLIAVHNMRLNDSLQAILQRT